MRFLILGFFAFFSISAQAGELSSPQLSEADFFNFASSAGTSERYVKFVVSVTDTQWTLEFFDSQQIKLHVDFLKNIKGVSVSVPEIYKQARFNEGRKYFFGAVILTESMFAGATLSFQLTAEDPLRIEDIVKVGTLVRASVANQTPLTYQPSGNQTKYVADLTLQKQLEAAGFPVLQLSAFQSKIYFAATTVGRFKKVSAKDIDSGAYLIKGDEILLLDYVPDSLPPVRGVITNTPTSPNSHVSLLANMYSIPFLFLQGGEESAALERLDGQFALFKTLETVNGQTSNNIPLYVIEKMDSARYLDYEKQWQQKFPQVNIKLDEQKLKTLSAFPKIGEPSADLHVSTCGAKASNASLLAEVVGEKNSVEGFCIPFYYFNKFLESNRVGEISLRTFILQEIEKITPQSKLEDVQAILAGIKGQITRAQIDSADVQKLKAMVLQTYGDDKSISKIRFRSSSNAEDDERFNGAGLYESDGLKLKHIYENNDKKVEESLKIVWSSLYGLRAVLARKMFKIDETKVYMGVLINQAFNETANGVSICQYPYAQSVELNCTIEGFPGGELSVAIPVPGTTSEIVRVFPNENYEFGIMESVVQYTSELEQYQRVLAGKELGELFKLQEKVYKYWSTVKKPGFVGSLDFEWKRMQDAKTGESYMALKQVREVPLKLAFTIRDPILVLPAKAEYTPTSIDGSASLLPLFSMRTLRIEIPAFTSLQDTKKIQTEVKIYSDDFLVTNQALAIQAVEYHEGEWAVDAYSNLEIRIVELVLSVEHPSISGLKMKLSYQQTKKNGILTTDNLIDVESLSIQTVIPQNQITDKASAKKVFETQFSFGKSTKVVSAETTSYCLKNEVVAKTTRSETGAGLYGDGASHMDSAWLSRKLFKAFKTEMTINDKKALVASYDSHAFEEGQFMTVESIAISPSTAKNAGLKEQEFYVVMAFGSNAETEKEGIPQALLFDKNKKLIERRVLSYCE